MSIAWPAGVPDRMMWEGYVREVEDVADRRPVDAGPPLRKLKWPTPHQTLTCRLKLKHAVADQFDLWRTGTLDHGSASFQLALRDHPAPRTVLAHFKDQPELSHASPVARVYALSLMIEAPAPLPGALAALAALDEAAPASWPSGVPSVPLRAGFTSQPATRVLRGDEKGPPVARLMTAQEGRNQKVSLNMTPAQLATFESWFSTTAAHGVRDISWPVGGATHLGCFASSYRVTALAGRGQFQVTFDRYLEAVA